MTTDNQDKQDRLRFMGRISFVISFLLTCVATSVHQPWLRIGIFIAAALALIMVFAFYVKSRWLLFKNRESDKYGRAFLTLNDVGHSICGFIDSFSRLISSGAECFESRKTKLEDDRRIILERLEEIDGRRTTAEKAILEGLNDAREGSLETADLIREMRNELRDHVERSQSAIAETKEGIATLNAELQRNPSRIGEIRQEIDALSGKLGKEQKKAADLRAYLKELSSGSDGAREITFKDLVCDRRAYEKADELFRWALEIGVRDKNLAHGYLNELAKFFMAMVDLEYVRNNQSAFASLVYPYCGNGRMKDSFRKTFRNACDHLIDYEYQDVQKELDRFVTGE